MSCVSISCRFLRNTHRAGVRVGCGGMGWGGGVVGWRAGAGWGWGICATRRDPARTHGAPQGGGAYRRSVSSFFSSSSICRGRSRAVRAVRHALGLGVGGQGNAHGKAAQGVVGSHSARSARARGVACCLYAAGTGARHVLVSRADERVTGVANVGAVEEAESGSALAGE